MAAAPGVTREALDEIYRNRICRRYLNGELEFYSLEENWALSAAILRRSPGSSTSLTKRRPPRLTPADRALGPRRGAALYLRAQGRFGGAADAMRAVLLTERRGRIGKTRLSLRRNLSDTRSCLSGNVPPPRDRRKDQWRLRIARA